MKQVDPTPEECRALLGNGVADPSLQTRPANSALLARCNGVLVPPPVGDPDIAQPPPPAGNTPVIQPGQVPAQPGQAEQASPLP